MTTNQSAQVIVAGAGAAGLGVAAMLKRHGVAVVVLEREQIGASWRKRYQRLRLNSTRLFSSLPGQVIEREHGRWVDSDDFADYLGRYTRQHRLEVRCKVKVLRVDRGCGRSWHLHTGEGGWAADAVVLATGYDHAPFIPEWPGREEFAGRLIHSAAYRRPDEFVSEDVLVVGAGNSGFEIALDLAEGGARKVWLSIRSAPIVLAHEWHGIPATWFALVGRALPPRLRDRGVRSLQQLMFGDLTRLGLPAPEKRASSLVNSGRLPTIDKGTVEAIKRGRIEVVAGLDRLTANEVVLSDSRVVAPHSVIAATAYRRGLEPLVGHLGVLDEAGRPCYNGPASHPRHPGLYFSGYRVPLTGHLSAHLFGARRTAYAIRRYLRTNTAPSVEPRGPARRLEPQPPAA